MKVRELRLGIEHLNKLLSSWQAKAAAGDLDRLAALLQKHDDLSVTEFCTAVESAFQTPSLRGHQQLVPIETWLEELRQSENSKELFEPLISRIKKMPNRELFALANAYCGIDAKFKKKADAVEAIREKSVADGSVQRQLKGISGIF